MAASNTRFTQNSLGQSKTPIDSDHGIYRDLRNVVANYAAVGIAAQVRLLGAGVLRSTAGGKPANQPERRFPSRP
jgi:hypothetical protein